MGRRAVSVFLIGLVGWLAIPAVCASAAEYGATVEALDNVFAEQIVRIQPGQTVEWTNEGHAPHTVTADDGSWDTRTTADITEARGRG
jgi:plastocyanin